MLQRGAVLLDAPQYRLQVATAVVAAQRHLTNQSTGVKELTINQSIHRGKNDNPSIQQGKNDNQSIKHGKNEN